VHGSVAQLRVDRVAAAAEVDEVEERKVLLELLRGDGREALEQLGGWNRRLLVLAAGREQVGEQRLQDRESFGRDGAGRRRAGPGDREDGRTR